MKSNITLIGMPGAGKSTIGIILAKNLGLGFIDTDILIQITHQQTLQQIIDASDHLNLRAIEEKEILKLDIDHHVIATGGSVVYSEHAMMHLARISKIVYLEIGLDVMKRRLFNVKTRGIAKAKGMTLEEMFQERQALYQKYAQITIDCNARDQETLAAQIAKMT